MGEGEPRVGVPACERTGEEGADPPQLKLPGRRLGLSSGPGLGKEIASSDEREVASLRPRGEDGMARMLTCDEVGVMSSVDDAELMIDS